MRSLRERVDENPVKCYLLLTYSFTLFFLVLFMIIMGTVYISMNHLMGSFFNTVNMSALSSDVSTSSLFHINLDFLASMITLFGGFGGLCYLFFSIREGKISQNERFQYVFEGFLIVILFLDVFLGISLFTGTLQTQKIIEMGFLIAFPIIAVIFSIPFRIVFNTIEENYEHRVAIVNFLRKSNEKIIISPKIDPVSRAIFRSDETFSAYIFILLIGMIFYGALQNFNPLTIISTILFSLIIYIGYSRLISLSSSTTDIELIKQEDRERNPDGRNSLGLSNIFVLKESSDFFTVLTKKHGVDKILTISKNCVCSIRDHEYEIFKEEEHPFAIWVLTRLVRTLLTLIAFSVIFGFLVSFIPTKQSWILFFIVLLSSLFISIYGVYRMRKWIDGSIETLFQSINKIFKEK